MENRKVSPKKLLKIIILFIAVVYGVLLVLSLVNKKDVSSQLLNARAGKSSLGITIYNKDAVEWKNCRAYLNDDYKTFMNVSPGGNLYMYERFVTDKGTRFNYFVTEPVGLYLECENPAKSSYLQW